MGEMIDRLSIPSGAQSTFMTNHLGYNYPQLISIENKSQPLSSNYYIYKCHNTAYFCKKKKIKRNTKTLKINIIYKYKNYHYFFIIII